MPGMPEQACDIMVRDGLVLDGLGGAAVRLDVAVTGATVRLLRPGEPVRAGATIDAAGCFVAPGFIDIHGHSDFASLLWPNASSRVAAGVTTECVGNCGYGAFPLAGEVLRRRQAEHAPDGLEIDWCDAEGYFARAQRVGCAINRVFLVGHGNLRGCVVGYGQGRATAPQLARMCEMLDACMAAGCAGLSSGLVYPPGMWADGDELAALAAVAARYDGLYAIHIRDEGDRCLESGEEFLRVLRRSGCRGQWSHVKLAGPANWDKIDALEGMFRAARNEGLNLLADRYPYTASATDLATIVLPGDALAGDLDELLARLAGRTSRRRIEQAVRRAKGDDLDPWLRRVVVTKVGAPALQACVGKNLAQIPALVGAAEPLEAALKLILDDRADTQAIHFSMNVDNLRRIYGWDFVAVGSDSSCRDYFGRDGAERPHPRAYGTPGEFVDLVVRRWKLMDWPEAVRRMTSLPAQALGLAGRGVLRDGAAADIVVFEGDRFAARATYEDPCQVPDGVIATLVNGQIVWHNGRHTGRRPGRLLRPRDRGQRQ